jgi:hypothetical protein
MARIIRATVLNSLRHSKRDSILVEVAAVEGTATRMTTRRLLS